MAPIYSRPDEVNQSDPARPTFTRPLSSAPAMGIQESPLPPAHSLTEAPGTRWSLPTLLAFRFFCLYFTLYVLATQMLMSMIILPARWFPESNTIKLWNEKLESFQNQIQQMVEWTATEVFKVDHPLVIFSGSGDKTFDWVLTFCLLVIAAAITIAWSLIAYRFQNHATCHKWFRLFLRFALGSTLVTYGVMKAIPLQMPEPSLTRLLEPYGQFTPMGVLWSSIGASPAYEIFTGCAELTAAILLFIPRTTLLGAAVALGVTSQVFILNMTYDVPVKLFSFHLVLMSLFLLAPDAPRLLRLFLLDRPAGPSSVPALFRTQWANATCVILQLLFAAYIIGMGFDGALQGWKTYGGGAPKSELYGVWNVTSMTTDSVDRPPLLTDNERWRRVVIDRPVFGKPSFYMIAFQRMDDSFAWYQSQIDVNAKTLTLTHDDNSGWTGVFTYEQPSPQQLILDGQWDGKPVHIQLDLFPRVQFPLVSRGFHWVQEYPYNH